MKDLKKLNEGFDRLYTVDSKYTGNLYEEFLDEDEVFSYDEAVVYLEKNGVSCDSTTEQGELVCDLLDEFADFDEYGMELYTKDILDNIISEASIEDDELEEAYDSMLTESGDSWTALPSAVKWDMKNIGKALKLLEVYMQSREPVEGANGKEIYRMAVDAYKQLIDKLKSIE